MATAVKAKQRFLALDVEEVSLVDHPANAEPFHVLKSLTPEEQVAQQKTSAERTASATEAQAEADVIKEVVATLKDFKDGKPNSADGDKQYSPDAMMKKLTALTTNKAMPPELKTKLEKFIAKAFPPIPKKDGENADDAPKDKDGKPIKPVKKEGEEEAAAKKEEETATAKVAAEAAAAGVQKAVGDGIGDPQVELIHSLISTAMGTLSKVSMLVDMEIADLDASPVEKGLKQFNPERVNALKIAAKQMVDLLKELNPAHLADLGLTVADSLNKGKKGIDGGGGEAVPTVQVAPGPAKGSNPPNLPDGPAQGAKSPIESSSIGNTIKKAVEDALGPVVTQLAEVKKSNEGLTTKIQELEKIRGVSKSLENTEDDPDKPVNKSKSLFAGLV